MLGNTILINCFFSSKMESVTLKSCRSISIILQMTKWRVFVWFWQQRKKSSLRKEKIKFFNFEPFFNDTANIFHALMLTFINTYKDLTYIISLWGAALNHIRALKLSCLLLIVYTWYDLFEISCLKLCILRPPHLKVFYKY